MPSLASMDPSALPLCLLMLSLLVFGAASAPPAQAAVPHPFTVQDLVSMDRLSDPQLSPDGRWVVYMLREVDLEGDGDTKDLWRVPVAGGEPERLTEGEGAESNPRFAPDGSFLYFLSTRSGSPQVWRLPWKSEAGQISAEPQRVTSLPLDVHAFEVSPDGERLAVALRVFLDHPAPADTAERLQEISQRPASGRVYDRLFVRHWDTWEDGRRNQLFVVPTDPDAEPEEAEPVWVSKGVEGDVPSVPFGGPEEITFTPDGREVVFAARVADAGEAWSTDFNLYAAPVDASAPPRLLTADNPAWDTQPTFSPDGKTLAYLAMKRPGYEADRFRILLRGWPEGETEELVPEWDRSPREIAFSPDGGTLWAVAPDEGNQALFAIDLASRRVERRVALGKVGAVRPGAEAVVYTLEHMRSPVDLYALDPDDKVREEAEAGSVGRRLTEVNAERLEAARMGEEESFTFAGWNGEAVQAWVVKPVDFDPARDPQKRYPLAFIIHGGPQGFSGNSFHYRWNPQTYAGAGYAVVMVNFHGSTGFGQEFTDSIRGDWGGKPLVDLRKGLAAALERYPWIDGDRACALGASYGGYMINWIAGNWGTENGSAGEGEEAPFRCLVNHDGIFDNRMMYYSTEELWFPEWEHGGPYYDAAEGHERHNPVDHVEKWTTPMLVIHGSLDYRIPETQGLATFTALQRRGIPSRYLTFPDENHWVLKTHNSILWHETVLEWLDRWTKEEGEP